MASVRITFDLDAFASQIGYRVSVLSGQRQLALNHDGRGAEQGYHVEVEAVPQEYHDDGSVTEGPREWVKMGDLIEDGILPHEVWDALLNAIDEQCKVEDLKRRHAAKCKR